jgi:hypothetical protein
VVHFLAVSQHRPIAAKILEEEEEHSNKENGFTIIITED